VTGPPDAADIAAIKSQFAATMLGSFAERPKTECRSWLQTMVSSLASPPYVR